MWGIRELSVISWCSQTSGHVGTSCRLWEPAESPDASEAQDVGGGRKLFLPLTNKRQEGVHHSDQCIAAGPGRGRGQPQCDSVPLLAMYSILLLKVS